MAVFKMHQLGNESACNKRRNFGFQVNEKKGENYYKAVAVKQAAKAIVKGASLEEVKKDMEDAFKDIPYQNQQRELLLSDSFAQIKRYISWETRPLMDAVSTNISLYDLMDVEVTPDFITADTKPVIERLYDKKTDKIEEREIADGTIEIIKLKVGRPMAQKSVKGDLGLLSMLMYGRKFYQSGRLQIKASYYYLKRTDDSFGTYPSFKDFDEKQICQISEIYTGDGKETDEHFKPIVEEFVNGHEEMDCDPKDCEKCILYSVCKGYTEAPVAVEREFKTKVSDISLNQLQQTAVEY